LLIVGEDGNRPGEIRKLKTLADNLGLADRVNFTGLVEYEKLPDYYNAADVFVFPSYYESFGLAPLESLACGTPVVVTSVGDLINIVREGETGYVLSDNEPQRLAEKIELVLKERTADEERQRAVHSSILRFGWQNIASSVVEEFKKLVERKVESYKL